MTESLKLKFEMTFGDRADEVIEREMRGIILEDEISRCRKELIMCVDRDFPEGAKEILKEMDQWPARVWFMFDFAFKTNLNWALLDLASKNPKSEIFKLIREYGREI